MIEQKNKSITHGDGWFYLDEVKIESRNVKLIFV